MSLRGGCEVSVNLCILRVSAAGEANCLNVYTNVSTDGRIFFFLYFAPRCIFFLQTPMETFLTELNFRQCLYRFFSFHSFIMTRIV